MNINKYRTSIVFSRKSKSREDLKKFDDFCKSDFQLNLSYMGYTGRTFFFGFPTKIALENFKTSFATMLEKLNIEFEQ